MVKYINSLNEGGVFEELMKIEAAKKDLPENTYGMEPSEDHTGKELIEKAHPETGKTIDSYRENGGVVENESTQQEEDIKAATRMPNGFSVSRKQTDDAPTTKKAEAELINELLIIAEEMKVRGHEDLEKFSTKLVDNIKKKSNLNKEALAPLAIGGIIAASAIIPLVGSWLWSSYSTSNDQRNTGIDNNIAKLEEHISAYMESFSQEDTGEQFSNLVNDLTELQINIGKIKKTRDTYLINSKALADQLRTVASVDLSKQPTAQTVMNNLTQQPGSQPALKPQTKRIVDIINRYNQRYAIYIKGTVLPALQKDLQYLTKYFTLTKSIKPVEKQDVGVWDSIKGFFGANPEYKNRGEKILVFLKQLIDSLDADIQLRELDSQRAIESISKKIETDISKDFALEDGGIKPKEEDMALNQ